jgi:hypothetical protein
VFSTVMQGAARLLRIPPGKFDLPSTPLAAPALPRQTVALPVVVPRT